MTDKTISELPAAPNVNLTDELPVTQNSTGPGTGASMRVTVQQQLDAMSSLPYTAEVDGVVVTSGGHAYKAAPSTILNAVVGLTGGVQGPAGPQGLQGPAGPQGLQGPAGQDAPVINGVSINTAGHLIVTLSNGATFDAGPLPVVSGGSVGPGSSPTLFNVALSTNQTPALATPLQLTGSFSNYPINAAPTGIEYSIDNANWAAAVSPTITGTVNGSFAFTGPSPSVSGNLTVYVRDAGDHAASAYVTLTVPMAPAALSNVVVQSGATVAIGEPVLLTGTFSNYIAAPTSLDYSTDNSTWVTASTQTITGSSSGTFSVSGPVATTAGVLTIYLRDTANHAVSTSMTVTVPAAVPVLSNLAVVTGQTPTVGEPLPLVGLFSGYGLGAPNSLDYSTDNLNWTAIPAVAITGNSAGSFAVSGPLPTQQGGLTVYLRDSGKTTVTTSATITVEAASATGNPRPNSYLGAYVANPGDYSNDMPAGQTWRNRYLQHVKTMDQAPSYYKAFVDNSNGWTTMAAAQAALAANWKATPESANLIPVIMLPMALSTDYSTERLSLFASISSGSLDTVFQGIVQAWRDAPNGGFSTIYVVPGYNFNLSAVPWYADKAGYTSPTLQNAFIAAFQRIATAVRGVTGITVKLVWSPAVSNFSNYNIDSFYPGNSYVDVIGTAITSKQFPLSTYDWTKQDGTNYGAPTDSSGVTNVPNILAWATKTNLEHYWDYPSAQDRTSPCGLTPGQLGVGLGLIRAMYLATSNSKPFALTDMAVGGDPNGSNGLFDCADFPYYIVKRLFPAGGQVAISTGASFAAPPVQFVLVTDQVVGTDDFDFKTYAGDPDPAHGVAKPLTKVAFAEAFLGLPVPNPSIAVAGSAPAGGGTGGGTVATPVLSGLAVANGSTPTQGSPILLTGAFSTYATAPTSFDYSLDNKTWTTATAKTVTGAVDGTFTLTGPTPLVSGAATVWVRDTATTTVVTSVNVTVSAGGNTVSTVDSGAFKSTANLFQWISSDNPLNTVSQVTDKSGLGHHLTQPSSTHQPAIVAAGQNGRAVYQFDGKSDYLIDDELATAYSGNPQPLHVFMVIKSGTSSTGMQWLGLDAASSNNPANTFLQLTSGVDTTGHNTWCGGRRNLTDADSTYIYSANPAPDGINWQIVELVQNSDGTGSIIVNNNTTTSVNKASGAIAYTLGTIGAFRSGNPASVSGYASGQLAEIGVVQRVLTGNERAAVLTALDTYWSLGLGFAASGGVVNPTVTPGPFGTPVYTGTATGNVSMTLLTYKDNDKVNSWISHPTLTNSNLQNWSWTFTDPANAFAYDPKYIFMYPKNYVVPPIGAYPITLTVTGSTGSITQQIMLTSVIEYPPTSINFTPNVISTSQPSGAVVGTATASDADNIYIWSLTDTAGGLFAINASTGVVTVAGTLSTQTYNIQIQVMDGSSNKTYRQYFAIPVVQGTVIASSAMTLNIATGVTNSTNIVRPPGGINTITLHQGNLITPSIDTSLFTAGKPLWSMTQTGSRFAIDPNTGVVTAADYLSARTYTLPITATDGINTCTSTATLVVSWVNGPTYHVGPGQQYAHINDFYNDAWYGSNFSNYDGATLIVHPGNTPDYYYSGNDLTANTAKGRIYYPVKIIGASGGPRPVFGGGWGAYSKCIFDFQACDAWIENIEITGATLDGNQRVAGIFKEAGLGDVTVKNCYIHNCDDGIQGGEQDGVAFYVYDTELAANGIGEGKTHNCYFGLIESVYMENCLSWGSNVGHLFKSRALSTTVVNSRFFDTEYGDGSAQMDIPVGGIVHISGCQFQKGANYDAQWSIHYGGEWDNGINNKQFRPVNSCLIENCSFYADGNAKFLNGGSTQAIVNGGAQSLIDGTIGVVTVQNCSFMGYDQNTLMDTMWGNAPIHGPIIESGSTTMATQPAFDLTNPGTGVRSAHPAPFDWAPGIQLDTDDLRVSSTTAVGTTIATCTWPSTSHVTRPAPVWAMPLNAGGKFSIDSSGHIKVAGTLAANTVYRVQVTSDPNWVYSSPYRYAFAYFYIVTT